MSNLLDYLQWRGDLSFDDSPFNEVDAVILARLSYLPYETVPPQPNGQPLTLRAAADALLAQTLPRAEEDARLLSLLRQSRRFGEIPLFAYENRTDIPTQTQFAALCFRLRPEECYLSFRGTDNTLVGWKEDFNMTFVCPVPAQELALQYTERIADEIGGTLLLGGHSKGGNLAVYGAAFCRPDIQARIRQVYNFDGPGFAETVLKAPGYEAICNRVSTFVPQSSIVGMMLGHEERYTIVQSTQKGGIFQHNIYSWQVQERGFLTLETVTNSSRFVDFTLKTWLAEMDAAQRETFIDTIYDVMYQTNAETLQELGEHRVLNTLTVMKTVKNLDEQTKTAVQHAMKLLLQSSRVGFLQMLAARPTD